MADEAIELGAVKGSLALLAASAALDASSWARGLTVQEALDCAARNAPPAVDDEHGERKVAAVDRAVHRRPAVAQEDGRLVHAQEWLGR
jgi:hypothetical protein